MSSPATYPTTIYMDRYNGGYAGRALQCSGGWLAWALDPEGLPDAPESGDSEAFAFWDQMRGTLLVGQGETPDAALADLEGKRARWPADRRPMMEQLRTAERLALGSDVG